MTDEKRVRRLQNQLLKADQDSYASGLKLLLSTAAGRRFLWLHLEECKAFSQPYTGNALDTSFNCGVMNVGRQLLARITETDPDAFLVMMKESQDEQRTRQRRAAELGDALDAD